MRKIINTILIMLLISAPLLSFAHTGEAEEEHCGAGEMWEHMLGGGDGTMMGNFGFGPGFFGFGFIFMIVFWGLIIWGIVALIKNLIDNKEIKHNEKSPLDILKDRYAKGEINKEEFEQKKKDLV